MTDPLPYRPHDHKACVQDAMDEARAICQREGARLTELREQVLELIWQSHRPLGAYDLLDMLNRSGRKAAPPTVYRTLDFLQEMGLVHRIASLNAFIGCSHPHDAHSGYFLLCEACHNVLEMPSDQLQQSIHRAAKAQGFQPRDVMVEISGTCPACQQGTASAS